MMQSFSVISVLALATTVLSNPFPAPAAKAEPVPAASSTAEGVITPDVAVAAMIAIQTQAPLVVNIASPPQYLTITVVNSHGDAISTSHAHDPSGPGAVSGNVGPGTMASGATAAFAVPTGWIGNVAINWAGAAITGDDSLIEANFVVPSGYSVAVADVDVSYVNGFSVAIVCSCSGAIVTGCNKNLFTLNSCADNDGQNACVNPERSDSGATSASPFFAPCQHAAWTYVNDGAANSWGQCQSGQITCCVGHACPPNPKQPA